MISHLQLCDPKRRLGWIPDLPDARDRQFSVSRTILRALPSSVDFRAQCPQIYQQGDLGSCTANAIGAAFEFDLLKQGKNDFMPSRLFIYYNERVLEHSVPSDAGAALRDGIKTLAKQGVCTEAIWPYDVSKFRTKPSIKCYNEGLKHSITTYQRLIPSLALLRGCLADGYPFVFGFSVYDSFMSDAVAKSGVMPIPDTGREHIQGGHAVMAVGYDDAKQRFIVRNSWGPGWGMKGYFTMPYDFMTNGSFCDDFWTIRTVQG